MDEQTGSFGIDLLDERLNGPVLGGLHALIGGPGTGKTVAALHFLEAGVRRGEQVAHLTQMRPEDVIELARSIGIDLAGHLRAGRWVLTCFRPGFRQRYRRTIEPREVFEELEAFLTEEGEPDRIVIDTVGPLVDLREAGNGAELLVDMLSGLRSTVLLTFAAENPAALDSAFDFVSQRAALILHLTMSSSGRRQFVVRKTLGRHDAAGPISFDIRDGEGIVTVESARRERSSDVKPEVRNRVLLLDVTRELPDDLRLWFEKSFDLFYTGDPVDAFPELARRDFGLVAVHVDRRTVDRGLHVMYQLRRAAGQPPILVLCGYDLRAADRARALRAGADDFISGGLNPDEVASRIEALLRRGRAITNGIEGGDGKAPNSDALTGSNHADVREIVRGRLKGPAAAVFSLILLRPANGSGLEELATHVAGRMRQNSGDRINLTDERVEVYLEGALAIHAERFLARVRTEHWNKVAAVVYTSPTDREELLQLVDPQDG